MWWCVYNVRADSVEYLGTTKAAALDKAMDVVGPIVKSGASKEQALEFCKAAAKRQKNPKHKQVRRRPDEPQKPD